MADAPAISLWDRTADEADVSAPLEGDAETGIAIVGGGFTGLSTALHAAERGLDCHVLEAQRIGHGGSGRNVGLLNGGTWLPPQDVRARLGEARGARLTEFLGAAPAYVMSLIERHQIRCELTRTGTVHAAHSPRGLADLERRAAEWRRLGAPVDLLSRAEAAETIGSDAFHGGLVDRRAGTLNPMGYVRGLARAAQGAGARISTGTAVRALSRDGGRWIVETDRGRVSARAVVLGTNAYSDDLWPGLRRTFTLIDYFQVATEPLGERADFILPGRQGLWDTAPVMFSVRRDAFGRVVTGSMGRVTGVSRRWAAGRLRRVFPALGAVAFETAWYGRIALTPDHLPRIHRLADGLYTPIGYNGRGIAPGTVFGRAMAELLAGGREEDLPLPVTEPQKDGLAPVRSRFYRAAFAANQLSKSL